jgi:hypothetical protein
MLTVWDDWADHIIFSRKKEPEMELPEDIYIFLSRKNKMLDELVERFDCQIEY